MHKLRAPERHGENSFFTLTRNILWVLGTESVACPPSGPYNFDVASNFFF